MDQDMDLTIGSLNFHVGSLGSIRLSDLTKPDPSASEPKTVAMSESSESSSSEVNSPIILAEAEERNIAGGDKTMQNLDLEAQLEDLMIYHDDTSDKSTDTWKTGLELSEDDNMPDTSHHRRQFRRTRRQQQSSTQSSKYKQRSKPFSRRINRRFPHNKGESSTISR
jgi:hypothetical protein